MSSHIATVLMLLAAIIALVLLERRARDEQPSHLPLPRPTIAEIAKP
jgi:hypothetical protein